MGRSIAEGEGGRGKSTDLSGILMPRRNISSWKDAMSWQSGQRKWCRAEHSAWPWGRAGISISDEEVPSFVSPPELGDSVTTGVITSGAGGDAAYLDAAAVEPGAGAGGTDQGVVAGPLRHHLQADEAGGLVLLHRPHVLHRPVLPAEGPAGRR